MIYKRSWTADCKRCNKFIAPIWSDTNEIYKLDVNLLIVHPVTCLRNQLAFIGYKNLVIIRVGEYLARFIFGFPRYVQRGYFDSCKAVWA